MSQDATGHPTLQLDGPSPDGPDEVTFVGNATVLVRCGGFTFLTDPNFLHQGEHAELGYGLRSRRRLAPALQPSQLPPLDFVVLSHHHGDHFDDVAARELDSDVPILTTHHATRKLRKQGFRRAAAMSTWQRRTVQRGDRSVTLTSLPAIHGPTPVRQLLPPVMGTMLEFARDDRRPEFRLHISGDTLVFDGLRTTAERFGTIDLSLLHLGGTRVLGTLLTMDAVQGREALEILRPSRAAPIHTDDYTVFRSSLDDFHAELERAPVDTVVETLPRGEPWPLPTPSAAS